MIPDAKFAAQNPNEYPYGWNPGGNILLAIGSGDTLVTPLQMADAYSAHGERGPPVPPPRRGQDRRPAGHAVKTSAVGATTKLPYTPAELSYIRSALATVPPAGPRPARSRVSRSASTRSPARPAPRAPAVPVDLVVLLVRAGQQPAVRRGRHGGAGWLWFADGGPIVRHIYEHLFGLPVTGNVNGGAAD